MISRAFTPTFRVTFTAVIPVFLRVVLGVVLGLVSPRTAHAQTAASVNREALFRRAFSSTAYVLSVASLQQSFIDSLSDDEGRMLVAVMRISQEARNNEWAKQNKIYRTAQGASAYVFHGNYHQPDERALLINYPVQAELRFSADQAKFKLRDNEPARSAMTHDGLNEPIFINTEIINQPKLQLSFADAIQIMIHEFGHKIGPQKKNQVAIDSLAAKIKGFVDAHTVTSRLSNGSAQIVKFSESVYADWHEETLQGRYVGVNIPPTIERFRAITDEGLYAFINTQSGTTDITDGLLADLAEDAKFAPYRGLEYSWKHFRQYSIKSVSVREFEPGKIRLEVDGTQAQTAIPFLIENDLDPVEYRPWARVGQKSEFGLYSYQRIEWTYHTETAQKLSTWAKPLMFEDTAKAEFVSVETLGADVVYTFRVPKSVKIQNSGLVPVDAFLIASLSGGGGGRSELIEIEGIRSSLKPDLVLFTLKNANVKMQGNLKPLNIEVEAQTRNLALPFYVRSRLFINKSEQISLNGQPETSAPKLISQSLVSGKLFLTFQSEVELQGLKLQLEIKRTATTVSKSAFGSESKVMGQGTTALPTTIVPVAISRQAMQQDLKNGRLHIAVDLANDFKMRDFRSDDLTPSDLPGPSRALRITEEVTTQVLSDFKVRALELTSQSGRVTRLNLSQPSANSCQDLFH